MVVLRVVVLGTVVLISTLFQSTNAASPHYNNPDEQQQTTDYNLHSHETRHLDAKTTTTTTTTIEFYHEKNSWGGAGGKRVDTAMFGGIRQRVISSSTSTFNKLAAVDSTTGVSHFRHINAPNLITFVFSNGRHESSGINSYATVDFNDNKFDPFNGITENLIASEIGGGAYTWVSTSTFTQQHNLDGSVKHYVLFSGGNDRNRTIFPSVLYSFQENNDGSLREPVWEWEAQPKLPARYGTLIDLGDIPGYNATLVSKVGNFDIIIAGYNGLDIYSLQEDGSYKRSRNLPVIGGTAVSFLGVDLYIPSSSSETLDHALLVVTSRSRWRLPGTAFDAPCFFYDYRLNQHFHYFAEEGQTLSVAVIDDHTQMLIGAGGNDKMEGQPNLMHKFTTDMATGYPSSALMDTEYQLVPGVSTTYNRMRIDTTRRTPEDNFEKVAFSGLTKTRQVFPFRLPGSTKDFIVEVNEGQPIYIYCRNENGRTFRIIPLQANENDIARAADAVVVDNAVYIVVAMFFTENVVYTVDMDLLTESPTAKPAEIPTEIPTIEPAAAPTTSAPTRTGSQQQQKQAVLELKCGSVASSSGYGGEGRDTTGCTRSNYHHESTTTKRIRGQATGAFP